MPIVKKGTYKKYFEKVKSQCESNEDVFYGGCIKFFINV